MRGHGRLMEPPNRSSLWRLKEFAHLNPPVNYNDNEVNVTNTFRREMFCIVTGPFLCYFQLSCGGFANQYDQNNGLCGPCGKICFGMNLFLTMIYNIEEHFHGLGDPYDAPVPRANENGGLYGRGIIARRYFGGQEISVTVELTRSHLGYFVFQLCPLSNPNGIETESCFGYPLQLSDGTGYKYHVSTMAVGNFETSLVLPRRACPHCVLRWHCKRSCFFNFIVEGNIL